MAVSVERHGLPRVSELCGEVGHRNALGNLHGRVAVSEVVRRVVGEAGRLAAVPHRVSEYLPRAASLIESPKESGNAIALVVSFERGREAPNVVPLSGPSGTSRLSNAGR